MKITLPFLVAISAFSGTISARSQAGDVQIDVLLIIPGTYNSTLLTDVRNVTTASGGTHLCSEDWGATPTTALADAAAQSGFTFDGTWNAVAYDFEITEINNTKCAWVFTVDGTPGDRGCRIGVKDGQTVDWHCLPTE